MMNFTVLGKYGPYPKPASGALSGYLFQSDKAKILLDMGSGTLARLMNACDINELDAVFISHLHFDHTSDLLPFRYLLESMGKKIKIITAFADSEWYKILFTHPLFEVINIDENTSLEIGDLKLSFYKTKHPATNYAVKLQGEKTFLYTGDTVFIPSLTEICRDCDAILADCAKPSDFKGPHMTSDRAIYLQEQTNAKLYVTHFAPNYAGEDFEERENVVLVEEGITYNIGCQ